MTLEEVLNEAGVDKEITLRRFSGNSALLARIIKQYPNDPTFGELKVAVSEQNREGMERAAHTLKGVAANLGFQQLSDHSASMVNLLRSGEQEGVDDSFAAITAEHEKIISCLAKLD